MSSQSPGHWTDYFTSKGIANFKIPLVGRIFLAAVLVECIFLFALIPLQLALSTQESRTYYLLCILVSALFLMYFSYDAISTENEYELGATLLVSLLLLLRISYGYFHPITLRTAQEGKAMKLVMMVAILFQCLYVLLGYRVFLAFGWRSYERIGTNIQMHELYRRYQIFLTLLKLDFQFGVILALLGALFSFDESASYKLITVAIFIGLTGTWALLGWQAVVQESALLMHLFVAFSCVSPLCAVLKLYQFATLADKYSDVPRLTIFETGALFFLCRIALLFMTKEVYMQFAQGLKHAIFDKEVRPALGVTGMGKMSYGSL